METGVTRQSNIELLRIVSMLLIVAHHYVVNSGVMSYFEIGNLSPNYIFLSLLGMWGKTGINIFILISGYFMCTSNLTVRRYCKVFFEWFFYNIVIYLVMLLAGYETFGAKRLFHLFFEVLICANGTGSFSSSFLIFYLFVPFMNLFIRSASRKEYRQFVLLLFFIFSILSTFFFNEVIFGEVFWFMAVYFMAAYIRLYPPVWTESLRASGRLCFCSVALAFASVLFMMFAASVLHTGSAYMFVSDANRLGAVLVSVTVFSLFKNLKIPYSKRINAVASTTFGVFLIHANSDAWRQFMWRDLLHVDTSFVLPLSMLMVRSTVIIVGVFIVCSMLDMVRIRLIEQAVFSHFEKIEHWMQRSWNILRDAGGHLYRWMISIAMR